MELLCGQQQLLCGKINIFATSLRLRPTAGIDVKRFQINVNATENQSF